MEDNEMLGHKCLHQRVEEFVRSRILSGQFAPGTRLPSTSELAKMTGASVFTVQTALTRICREGLVDRQANRATYVKGQRPVLTCAGIYFHKTFAQADSAFYQMLGQELRRKLGEKGVKVRFWTDERESHEQGSPIPSLKRAMEKREVQALIAPLVCEETVAWLKKAPVPAVFMGSDLSLHKVVWGDMRQLLRIGMEALKKQGCRSVGVIDNMLLPENGTQTAGFNFYRHLIDIAADLGLEIRNEWIRFPEKYRSHFFARFGYEQFHALWNLPRRPEGLLVYPDTTASGVVTAILERRISVPRNLKLALHANDLLPYLCPMPATLLQTKVGEFADAMIRMIYTQMEGGEVGPVLLPATAVASGTAATVS